MSAASAADSSPSFASSERGARSRFARPNFQTEGCILLSKMQARGPEQLAAVFLTPATPATPELLIKPSLSDLAAELFFQLAISDLNHRRPAMWTTVGQITAHQIFE
jgi:hypothetical protein